MEGVLGAKGCAWLILAAFYGLGLVGVRVWGLGLNPIPMVFGFNHIVIIGT